MFHKIFMGRYFDLKFYFILFIGVFVTILFTKYLISPVDGKMNSRPRLYLSKLNHEIKSFFFQKSNVKKSDEEVPQISIQPTFPSQILPTQALDVSIIPTTTSDFITPQIVPTNIFSTSIPLPTARVIPTTIPTQVAPSKAPLLPIIDISSEIVNEINKNRTKMGKSELQVDSPLQLEAKKYSSMMANKFGGCASSAMIVGNPHISVDGTTPQVRFSGSGTTHRYYNEVIAIVNTSAGAIVGSWLSSSSGHREAILSSDAKYIGIGNTLGCTVGMLGL